MYLSNNTSFTCPKIPVDMFDAHVQHRRGKKNFTFESLWDENGLVCYARSRFSCAALNDAGLPRCADAGTLDGGWLNHPKGLIAIDSDSTNSAPPCLSLQNECD
jgi:hypothetical protein